MKSHLLAAAIALAALPAYAQDTASGVAGRTPVPVTGEQVYRQVCAACHMQDAKGGAGAAAIPGLAANPMLAAPQYPVMVVTQGKGAMPWFSDVLSSKQITDVVNYVRNNFGNSYPDPVSEADVKALMQASADAH